MLPEPVGKIRLDATLKKYGNGKIPNKLLEPLINGGRLYAPAARFYNLMVSDAKKEGISLRPVAAGYRSLKAQESLFFDRYSPMPTLRKPMITRLYNGKRYWLRRGKSPSATPGTSPHGWGLAQDINVKKPEVFAWLCNNAPKYGFYLQGKRLTPNGKKNPEYEAWHWQFCNL